MILTEAFFNLRARRRARGFTLIEMMIVVTIMAILAAVAIPSYRNYNIRANRSTAAQLMLSIQSREEQYILDARTYTTALNSTGLNIAQDGFTCSAASCVSNWYTVSVAVNAGPPQTYTVTAVPISTTYQAPDGTLTLTSAGAKSRSAGDGKW